MARWKIHPKYPRYIITKKGAVFNFITGKVIRSHIKKDDGYVVVNLFDKNGVRKLRRLHKILAELFIPNPSNLPIAHHRNNKKWDYRLKNLEWVSYSQNSLYASQAGTHNNPALGLFGGDNWNSRKVKQLNLDGSLVKIWPSITDAKRDKGFLSKYIIQVCQGRRAKYKSFKWEYHEDRKS